MSTFSSFFTLIFASIIDKKRPKSNVIALTTLSVVGAAAIAWDDSSGTGKASLVGDLFALLSACFYGMYTVSIPKLSNPRDLHTFLGYVGVYTFVIGGPFILLLEFDALRQITLSIFIRITLNALLCTVLSDYIWAKAVHYTSELVATLAISATIPLSLIVDYFTSHIGIDFVEIVGVVCFLLGFFFVSVQNYKDKENTDSLLEINT
ncbi:hypothetical protein PCE1_000063 [Barthelona sp. PCE]